jgi:uncharacterized membrane protein HdeD (DUF308 family)
MTETTTLTAVRGSPTPWWIRLIAGLVLAVLGTVLMFSPRAAATTLAVLLGLALVVHGLDALLAAPRRPSALVAGALSMLAGGLAVAWPDATLWVVAVIAGMTCVAVGSLQVTTGLLARGEPGWAWVVAGGVASAVLGVLALTWPGATALVLALLLGIRTLALGVTEIFLAVEIRRGAALPTR